jgi:hypothetical protein
MAENRTFTLVGKFDDQITKKLKGINDALSSLGKTVKKDLTGGFKDLNKEVRFLSKELNNIGKNSGSKKGAGRITDSLKAATAQAEVLGKTITGAMEAGAESAGVMKNSIQAATAEAEVLGKTLKNAMEAGAGEGSALKGGIQSAQEEAKILGSILKANSLIKVGEGVGQGLQAGVQNTMGLVQKGVGFVGDRFGEAVKDQLGDVMARGGLSGSLTKEGMFKGALEGKSGQQLTDATNQMYRQTKNISRSMDGAINEVIRTSTVSSEVIQTFSRQLGDNLLPSLLKERGITDLSNISREKLNDIMGGEKGVGKELATLYSQMGSIISNPSYAPSAAKGVTQFLGSGSIDTQLDFFQQNPVFANALKEYSAGATTTGQRIKALAKALKVAMPEAALEESKNTIAGGMQSVHDTLLGPSGILGLTADIDKQGQKTLKIMQDSGTEKMMVETNKRRNREKIDTLRKEGKSEKLIAQIRAKQIKEEEKYVQDLEDFYATADSPIEVLGTQIGPLFQSIANMLNEIGNVFIGPVNALVETMGPVIAKMIDNFDNIGSNLRAGGSPGEALGRALAELLKGIATMFDPSGLKDKANNAIDKFFEDFAKGFQQVSGGKDYMKTIMDGIMSIVMRVLFKKGDVAQGPTGIGKLIMGVFAAMASGPVILAVVTGATPLIIEGFLGLLTGIFGAFTIPVILVAGMIIFQDQIISFAQTVQRWGKGLQDSSNLLTKALGVIVEGLGKWLEGATNLFAGLWDTIVGLVTGDTDKVVKGIKKIFKGIAQIFEGIGKTTLGLGEAILVAVDNFINVIVELLRRAANKADFLNIIPDEPTPGSTKPKPNAPKTRWNPTLRRTEVMGPDGKWAAAAAQGSANPFYGNLNQAIDYEMKHKPPGSDLVVANSSEEIYPAARGLNNGGMEGVIDAIYNSNQNLSQAIGSGFSSLSQSILTGDQAQASATQKVAASMQAGYQNLSSAINRSIMVTQAGFSAMAAKIAAASAAGGMGGLGGGAVSGVDAFNGIASGFGLQLTSGYRPGSAGWHGVNRARDYSNSTGPTPEMMKFAQTMAGRYGSNLKELIYTPLGFSIKNGQKTAPYAQAGHYNHVHVAYAGGLNNPAFLPNKGAAERFEAANKPYGTKVRSITSNTSEMFGSGITVNAPITIHQQPGQSGEALAIEVARRLNDAIQKVRDAAVEP